ncbi:hypothetical protein [Archangium primigenium]|uniref:COG1470 family protein n=1 Tax=[Archangium] primigenium TaxID=2792470 RepID=UPI00195A8F6D|nr:hypothetical protein [Archangium primigenium]MBM7116788.1 hypothetical protein [Archangium primigenium]
MPRAFDLTATTPQVDLDASGHGEVAFTLSNRLGTAVGVRATVEPSGGTPAGWMTFPEGAERALAPDGTAVLPVRITVPPGTPPGAYGFSVVVASQANPDEHYDRSPAVAFRVVAAAPVAKKRFPWWIVALAAGVLLIGGGGLALFLSRGSPPPPKVVLGGACDAQKACASPLACEQGLCRGNAGFKPCEQAGQCVTGRCEATECKERLTLGDACDSADDCRSPLTCHLASRCLLPLGEVCTDTSQCTTGACVGGKCTPNIVRCPRCRPGEICREGRCENLSIVVRDPRLLEEFSRIRQPLPHPLVQPSPP